MTRSEMRVMLRSRLQEDDGYEDQWTNAKLNGYLSRGLEFMETEMLKYDPEAYMQIDKTSLYAADDGLVPMPMGCITVRAVWIYDSVNSKYVLSARRNKFWIDGIAGKNPDLTDDESDYLWAPFGRWIKYWPERTTTLTDGMKIEYVPTLAMGADTDVPDLHLNLHEGVVYRAQEIALGDTDETNDPAVLDALNKRLSVVVSRIPLYIQPEHGQPAEIEVDIDKEEGWS